MEGKTEAHSDLPRSPTPDQAVSVRAEWNRRETMRAVKLGVFAKNAAVHQ